MAKKNSQAKTGYLFGGFRLGRVFGIDVLVDWSLLIIFSLIVFNLGVVVFPLWQPGWSTFLQWTIATLAAVLFFASILAHEMSHALVARKYDIPVNRITLFVFGGMAHMEEEPGSPKAEFLMAGVGPLVSLLIGAVSLLGAGFLAADVLQEPIEQPQQFFQRLSPAATLLLWLGPINILLAIFNMLPGFPLDGGRVFRSIIWWATGSLSKATTWASRTGQGLALLLMGSGAAMALGIPLPVLGAGLLQGVWFLLIGWFLHRAAVTSRRQQMLRETLHGVPVSAVMRRQPDIVGPEMLVSELVANHLLQTDQRAFPVVSRGELLGVVHWQDVRKLPADKRHLTTVYELMTPAAGVDLLTPQQDAFDALQQLSDPGQDDLFVVEDGYLQGMVRRREIARWLALQKEQGPRV